MEGPRGLEERELPSAIKLANAVFRPNGPSSMDEEYPLLFSKTNVKNMRAFIDKGEVVSLIGIFIRDAIIMGCQIRTASLGAVCTHPDYRNRGLATRLMKDASKRAIQVGAQVMLISGDRGLYKRHGCVNAGMYKSFFITKDQLETVESNLNLRRYVVEDIVDIIKLHQLEPLRFIRSYEDFRALLAAKMLVDRKSETYVIEQEKKLVAYICLQLPSDREYPLIIEELAGSRAAIVAKLSNLMDEIGTESAIVDTPSADISTDQVMLTVGAKQISGGFTGTIKLLDVKGFLKSLDPYMSEILGTGRRQRLSITYNAHSPELRFEYGGESLSICGIEKITAFIFGTIEESLRTQLEKLPAVAPELRGWLDTIFPIPLVNYGLNYV